MKKIYSMEEVFVPVGFPENTYIVRPNLDKNLRAARVSCGKQILIYDPSKSGKSNLWRKHFNIDEFIKVPINSAKTLDNVYEEILNELNAFYTPEMAQELGLKASVLGELQAKLASVFSAKVQASAETTRR